LTPPSTSGSPARSWGRPMSSRSAVGSQEGRVMRRSPPTTASPVRPSATPGLGGVGGGLKAGSATT